MSQRRKFIFDNTQIKRGYLNTKKIAVFILLFLFLFITLSACSKIKQPNDGQIAEAYDSAREAMGWFQMTTMPVGIETDPNMPVQTVPIDPETGAARVYHSTIKKYDDLKNHLQSLFSKEITEELLSTGKYFDKDGVLYTIPSDRGSNINKGKETYEIIKERDTKIIYRVTVEDFGTEDLETVVGYTVHDMIYEYVDGNWIFTKFELVR